jgi:hypothetical protein
MTLEFISHMYRVADVIAGSREILKGILRDFGNEALHLIPQSQM